MRKKIEIIISSNGGTIVGKTHDDGSYSAGRLSIDETDIFFKNIFSDYTSMNMTLIKGVSVTGSQNITIQEFVQIALNHLKYHNTLEQYSLITIGTDNVEFLQLFLSHVLPHFSGSMILTGAMVPNGGIGKQGDYYDGIVNLRNAVRAIDALKQKMDNQVLTLFDDRLYYACHKQNVMGIKNAFASVHRNSIFASLSDMKAGACDWLLNDDNFRKRQSLSASLSRFILNKVLESQIASYTIIDNFDTDYLCSLQEDIIVFSASIPSDIIIEKLQKNGKILVGRHKKMVTFHNYSDAHGAFLLSLIISFITSEQIKTDKALTQKISELFKYDTPLFYAEKIGLLQTHTKQKSYHIQKDKIEQLPWIIINQTPQSHDVTKKHYVNAASHTKIIFHRGTGNGNVNEIALLESIKEFIYSGGIHVQSTQCIAAKNRVIDDYREAKNVFIFLNYSLQDLTVVCEREDWKNLLIHIDYYKNSVKKSPVFNIEAMSEQCFMKNYYDYLLSLKLWLKEQLYSNNPNKIVIVQ